MPRHLISDAHEWINEIPSVPIYSPCMVLGLIVARGWQQQRFISAG
jgi:hypothetical protein